MIPKTELGQQRQSSSCGGDATPGDVCCMPLRVLQALTNLTTLSFDGGSSMYEAFMARGICPLLQALSNLVNLHCTLSNFTCQVQCINIMTRLRSLEHQLIAEHADHSLRL